MRAPCKGLFGWGSLLAAISALGRGAQGLSDPLAESDAHFENHCLKFYAVAESWSTSFNLQDTVHGFSKSPYGDENAFPGAERTKEGIFLVPGLDVSITKRPGCMFAPVVMLSESEDCKDDPTKPSQVEEIHNAQSSTARFWLTLPQARQRLFSGALDSKFKDFTVDKVSLKLFFCVKPGPAEEFAPMHLLWYFQDAKPEQLESIWQAPDAKLHPDLKLQHPELWHDEERHRLEPPKPPAPAKKGEKPKETKKADPSDLPAYGYTLMHFQAIDKPIDLEYEEEQPLVDSSNADDLYPEAGSGAYRCSRVSLVSSIALTTILRLLP